MIQVDDAYTGTHSREVVNLVLEVSERLGLGRRSYDRRVHGTSPRRGEGQDPRRDHQQAGPLDPDERAQMNTHTLIGEEMLEPIGGLLGQVGRIVRSCHERWDGSGYPDGLAGEEIPLLARIVSACDTWSAMTTDRPYVLALAETKPLPSSTARGRRSSTRRSSTCSATCRA